MRTDTGTPHQRFLLGDLAAVLAVGASAQASIRGSDKRRYRAPGNPIAVAAGSFVIADRATLAWAGIGLANGTTYSDARAALKAGLAPGLDVQILATHELMRS